MGVWVFLIFFFFSFFFFSFFFSPLLISLFIGCCSAQLTDTESPKQFFGLQGGCQTLIQKSKHAEQPRKDVKPPCLRDSYFQ